MISYTSQELADDAQRRIYIHGFGKQGIFLAFHLSRLTQAPPITVIVHEMALFRKFVNTGKKIYLIVYGKEHEASGFDMEFYSYHDDGGLKLWSTSKFGPGVASPALTIPQARINDSKRVGKIAMLPGVREVQPLPIINLFSTVRPSNNTTQLLKLRDRLSWSSTIIATQQNFGVLEELCERVFKVPDRRPTFRIAALSHAIKYAREGTTDKSYVDDFEAIMKNEREDTNTLRVSCAGLCCMFIGPITGATTPRLQERQRAAQYFMDTVQAVPEYNAKEVTQAQSVVRRTLRMVPTAILGPLSALKECYLKDLLGDEETRQVATKMIEELWSVMRYEWRQWPLTLEKLTSVVIAYIEKNPDMVHSMLVDVISGKETDIDAINGWLVNRGELLGHPCPTHKAVIELVKKKTSEFRIKKEEQKAALEAKQKLESRSLERDPRAKRQQPSEEEFYGPDKLEKKRMEKLARRREKFGQQPLPESYVKPKIQPIGGVRRLR